LPKILDLTLILKHWSCQNSRQCSIQ